MSNIRNVQWNNEVPAMLMPGMLVRHKDGAVQLIGDIDSEFSLAPASDVAMQFFLDGLTAWAWLIQPSELDWLEDMASRKTRTQE
ncbi:TPA: hypothetical protein ACGBGH_003925 [Pseudomonas aeruginosa]